VSRRILSLAGVFLLLAVATALAQEASTTPAPAIPAASRYDIDCSGFIAGSRLPEDVYIVDGADNDFHQPLRQFVTGDTLFLGHRPGTSVAEGTEYSLVRPGNQIFQTTRYAGQHSSLRTLGKTYVDVGRIKVTRLTPQGVIAEVTFGCGPVYPGDLAVPYKARAIPDYTPTKEFDRFAPPNGKMLGAITAAKNNAGAVGQGAITYINLGESDGVKTGQRFRIFRMVREPLEGLFALPDTPLESVGEMVILTTQERSSVGIVVKCVREIYLGDGVELE